MLVNKVDKDEHRLHVLLPDEQPQEMPRYFDQVKKILRGRLVREDLLLRTHIRVRQVVEIKSGRQNYC